ncbi:probable inactive purple acid phosphatase 16 [Aristolochia californica]|uniref:probable inactive purple acid phosphatase 16 n=1 Tax=Aristolochia californica TaxID=171875 RepID=UPI0035DC2D4C
MNSSSLMQLLAWRHRMGKMENPLSHQGSSAMEGLCRIGFLWKCFSTIFLSTSLLVCATNGNSSSRPMPILRTSVEETLRFSPDSSSFKIALFADLHYGEDAWTDWGPRQDLNSDRVMSTVLEAETPDFVIYLGDVITANNLPTPNASMYWDQAISPTKRRGIPWATLFGNHDDAPFEWPLEWFSAAGIPQLQCLSAHSEFSGGRDGNCSFRGIGRVELMEREIKNDILSYSRSGPRDLWPSVSNYVLKVCSSKDPKQAVSFLYFLDSGGGSYPEVISHAQVEWFQQKAEEINPDSSVPEIVFWHIPSKAFRKAAPKFGIHKPCVGSINKESVASQEAEWGIMKILGKRPSVKAVFVGHNHGLDWCCPYNMLWLCFARHTGYGGYGNWPRGARIIDITEQPFSLKSWIRMEDNLTHSIVVLS